MAQPRVYPTPHGEKLNALLRNPKLPTADLNRAQAAMARYDEWIAMLKSEPQPGVELLTHLVTATNSYKRFIEVDLIFNSDDDFLYRQKGQLKLDNTVLEEFFPYLVDVRLIPGLNSVPNLAVGPLQCYGGMFFGAIGSPLNSGGVFVKCKDQDFTVAETLFVTVSRGEEAVESDYKSMVNVAYFAAELKTNLDKTMFQEAAATSRELKSCVGTAIYLLICEWLDMPPIDTRTTAIDEVIILRKAKRLNSNVRSSFSTAAGRRSAQATFEAHIDDNPLNLDSFARVLMHLNDAFPEPSALDEATVLQTGYF